MRLRTGIELEFRLTRNPELETRNFFERLIPEPATVSAASFSLQPRVDTTQTGGAKKVMYHHTVSRWQKASTLAAFLQVGAVLSSLYFIGSQLNQQKLQLEQQIKLSRAANTQALVNLLTPLNLRVTDRAMTELWVKGDCGIDKVSDVKEREIEREQYETLVANNMVFYENAYSQYRAGLLDEEIYEGWDKDLAGFIEEHRIARHWDEWKDVYRKDFSDHVYQIIASQKPLQPCGK